jgi:hypothetical protein
MTQTGIKLGSRCADAGWLIRPTEGVGIAFEAIAPFRRDQNPSERLKLGAFLHGSYQRKPVPEKPEYAFSLGPAEPHWGHHAVT